MFRLLIVVLMFTNVFISLLLNKYIETYINKKLNTNDDRKNDYCIGW